MVDIYTLHFDGACGPKNPGGTAAYGYTLSKFGEQLDDGNGVIGSGPAMSNNVAEYVALCKGVESFLRLVPPGYCFLNVRGDSQLVIKQMSKVWKAKSGLYYDSYVRAVALASQARGRGAKLSFEWIPREMNQLCDDLSKRHLAPCHTAS